MRVRKASLLQNELRNLQKFNEKFSQYVNVIIYIVFKNKSKILLFAKIINSYRALGIASNLPHNWSDPLKH